MNEQNLHELLPPLMKKHGVKLYLCGHEHDAQHIERDGIHNVLTGHGGDMRPTGTTDGTRFAESRLGFGYLTITRAAIRADFVDSTGEIPHRENRRRRAGRKSFPDVVLAGFRRGALTGPRRNGGNISHPTPVSCAP